MAQPVLLDTCAAIWLMNGDPISDQSRAAIAAAQTENLGIYISPMTAWEIAALAAKNRLQLTLSPEAWFDALLRLPSVRLAPMPPGVLIASASLPGAPPNDPVDRIIAATSRTLGFLLMTRNGELIRYSRTGHIDAVEC
jgi:PIN domain nuclease of toxin-antitoxin system